MEMRKTIWFWLCFVCAIVLAIYFSARIVMIKMNYGKPVLVHNISIVADRSDVDLSPLRDAVSVSSGTPLYSVNLESINNQIANVAGVKKSSIRRLPNGTISVHVQMHNVLGLYQQSDGMYYPISDDGFIVNDPSVERQPNTILFRGAKPKNITKITQSVTPLTPFIDYIEWIENRRWNIYTTTGITILLPEDVVGTPEYEPNDAIVKLNNLNQEKSILSRAIKVIDLRDNKRILVQ